MSFRFFRRMKLAPGLSLNLSKSGPSLSFGPPGAKLSVGRRGMRRTVGLPGTGAYFTREHRWGRETRPAGKTQAPMVDHPDNSPEIPDRLTLGFFKRLLTPKGEEAFVDGMKALISRNHKAALAHLQKSVHLADGAFLAGMMALKLEKPEEAIRYFGYAMQNRRSLGKHFRALGIDATFHLPITPEIMALVVPDRRGILLAQVEAFQQGLHHCEAIQCLKALHSLDRDDLVARASLADILVNELGDRRSLTDVLKISENLENGSALHGTLLLYRAKALRLLDRSEAARATLAGMLRRKKGRSDALLNAIRYERGIIYETLGQATRASQEFQRLYADDPKFEDVARRLDL